MATPGSYTSSSASLSQSQQHPYTIQRDISVPSAYSMMQQSPAPSQMMSPTKDLNVVNMCRAGQEIVHDIVGKAQDMFTSLGFKNMQLPNNVSFHGQMYAERKAKLDEQVRQITMNFRKLRIFYSRINEACEQMEMPTDQELIPIVGTEVEKTQLYSDNYHYVVEQHREMVEQVRLKNQQLKELLDSMRSIIWEINTMITMRKTG